jgi:uncharacterized membrane protein
MSIAAVALSFATLMMDDELDWNTFGNGPFSTVGTVDGARTVLATIAGSMITVASLTFSVTIASLSLASSQFGPRLVRNFIRDTGNQIVLGTFIATFIYCLLILRTVKGSEDFTFVPSISLLVGILLAMASLGVLIYFINHIALSIQATRIIGTIAHDLTSTINRLYPEKLDETEESQDPEDKEEWTPPGEPRRVYATRSGYLQAIQHDDLVSLARDASVVLHVPHHPGQFIAKGSTIAEIYGEPGNRDVPDLDERVVQSFWLGNDRSSGRDIEFYIDQLVEIAVRALSPGINDPFTAMQCLDQLGASLRQLAERKLPSPNHRDEDNTIRLVATSQTLEGAIGAAFNMIRQYGGTSPPVAMRMMEVIAVLAEYAPSAAHRDALLLHARMVESSSAEHLQERVDIEALEERFRAVIDVLEREQDASPRG